MICILEQQAYWILCKWRSIPAASQSGYETELPRRPGSLLSSPWLCSETCWLMGAAGRETQLGLVLFLSRKPYLLLCAKSCERLQLSQRTVSLGNGVLSHLRSCNCHDMGRTRPLWKVAWQKSLYAIRAKESHKNPPTPQTSHKRFIGGGKMAAFEWAWKKERLDHGGELCKEYGAHT